MIYVGVKMMIVTSVCVFTTVLTLSLLTSGYVGYMCAVDVVVNCVCLVLMTGYYPDFIYYERLCCLCLRCCPKRYRKKKALMTRANTFSMINSKSTTAAISKDDGKDGAPSELPSPTDVSPQTSAASTVPPITPKCELVEVEDTSKV